MTAALVIFAFLPYNLDRLDLDVRLLLLANVPAVAIGWALGRYTRLGTSKGIILLGIAFFALILILLRGVPFIAAIQPESALFWAGWRPEVALLLVMSLAGMFLRVSGLGITDGKDVRVKVIAALATLAAIALVYFDFHWSGVNVWLLFLANLPVVGLGWAIAHYTRLSFYSMVGLIQRSCNSHPAHTSSWHTSLYTG